MTYNRIKWAVRVTHTPTGISAERTSEFFRSQHLAKESAMRYVKSKLYFLYAPEIKESDLIIEEVEGD